MGQRPVRPAVRTGAGALQAVGSGPESIPILHRADRWAGRTAVVEGEKTAKYDDLVVGAHAIASKLRERASFAGAAGMASGPRVGIYSPPGASYVQSTWGTWLAGGVTVPLALIHPPYELEYTITDSGIDIVLTTPELLGRVKEVAAKCGVDTQLVGDWTAGPLAELSDGGDLSSVLSEMSSADDAAPAVEAGALIMYTSGTTGRPKGVLHTHSSLAWQMGTLCDYWGWQTDDAILHCLPLHHVHGIVNALHCAHYTGATVRFLPKFSPTQVWDAIIAREINVFMGVPTMYSLLLRSYEKMDPERQAAARDGAAALRLAISGSAACPVPIMEAWRALSGQTLLERYGMTEIGMALSNPYDGERREGFVGLALPGVETRIEVGEAAEGETVDASHGGELLVRGGGIFKEYWNRPDATAEAFTDDGFFRTGDTVVQEGDPLYFRILGRTSVDIIKYGGYKISALEVESCMLDNDQIGEVAVLGVPDDIYGETISALVVLKDPESELDTAGLQSFLRERLAPYKVPKEFRLIDAIPRNAMGKVNKKQLLKDFYA